MNNEFLTSGYFLGYPFSGGILLAPYEDKLRTRILSVAEGSHILSRRSLAQNTSYLVPSCYIKEQELELKTKELKNSFIVYEHRTCSTNKRSWDIGLG